MRPQPSGTGANAVAGARVRAVSVSLCFPLCHLISASHSLTHFHPHIGALPHVPSNQARLLWLKDVTVSSLCEQSWLLCPTQQGKLRQCMQALAERVDRRDLTPLLGSCGVLPLRRFHEARKEVQRKNWVGVVVLEPDLSSSSSYAPGLVVDAMTSAATASGVEPPAVEGALQDRSDRGTQ